MSTQRPAGLLLIKREQTLDVLEREALAKKAAIYGMENGHRRVLGLKFDKGPAGKRNVCGQILAAVGRKGAVERAFAAAVRQTMSVANLYPLCF